MAIANVETTTSVVLHMSMTEAKYLLAYIDSYTKRLVPDGPVTAALRAVLPIANSVYIGK